MFCPKRRVTGDWAKKRFAKKLELVLDAGWDAERVLAEAETEFARDQRDMYGRRASIVASKLS